MVKGTARRLPASRGAGPLRWRLAVTALVGAATATAGTAFWRAEQARLRACVPDPADLTPCQQTWQLQLLVGAPVVLAVAALVLYLGGVRRPLLIALAGGLVSLLLLVPYEAAVTGTRPPPSWLGALLGAVGFILAALLVAPGIDWRLRLTVAIILAAMLPFLPTQRGVSPSEQRREALAALPVPLLVPELEAYPIRSAYPNRSGDALVVRLSPDADPLATEREIRVVTLPLPPGFAPPGSCGPRAWQVVESLNLTSEPCRIVGPDRWERTEPRSAERILRRGEVLVVLAADPTRTPPSLLDAAVANLRVATADELAGKDGPFVPSSTSRRR